MKKTLHIRPDPSTENTDSVLLLETGKRFCCFALFNSKEGELTELGLFESEKLDVDLLEELLLHQPNLKNGISKCVIGYWSPEAVLVPSPHFRQEEIKTHIDELYGTGNHATFQSEALPAWNIHNMYRVPDQLTEAINRRWSGCNLLHHYSVLLKNQAADPSASLLVDFRNDEFSVLAMKDNELLLAQTYNYSAPADVLYYLLKIVRQLGLSQHNTKVLLSGWIDDQSATAKELNKFFINVAFEPLPSGIRLHNVFSDYPSYYFSSICKLATCVS